MSNPKYAKGANFEREVQQLFIEAGFYAVRSAGSHGKVDVVAVGRARTYFIQCKTNGEIASVEWNTLLTVANEVGAVAVIASKDIRGGIRLDALNGLRSYRGKDHPKVELDLSQQSGGGNEWGERRFPPKLLEVPEAC